MSSTSRLECIQTKRKCDRTWPRCQRCVTRDTECRYIGRNRPQPQQSPDSDVDQPAPISEHLGEQPSNGALFEFTNHFNLAGQGDFIFNSIQDEVPQRVSSSARPDIVRAVTSDSKLQARVEFVAKRLTRIPRIFAQHGHTTFIHQIQFQQSCSPALQDAMSACALYCMKSVANQTTDMLLASRTDLLAALQALLLYQVMRLFDGVIRLRAHAEADEPVAILWASQLNALTFNAEDTPMAASGSTDTSIVTVDRRSDWQSWLVNESIRRTVITTFMLKGVYSFLKPGYDEPIDLNSAIGWCRAQEETEQLEIWVKRWDEAIAKANPVDLEEFVVLIMTMIWGPEATRKWLGDNITLKYGLEMS
ncbi:hypothetical protein BOTCAL_0258g00020 [Botryotinia calthae]|uniref:Zn(2)-C6 fungal-type domain-containing protein n=1 Tax=Botryotinia calthae TaxID=38488 RepID=A0A4Y8CZ10_9HELO|nr:hypothetical protein BOTCAL_0258g00020 [Botryotinia calthae]